MRLAERLEVLEARLQAAEERLATVERDRATVLEIQHSVNQLIAPVAAAFGLSTRELLSDRRQTDIARARQAAYWLAWKATSKSYPQIGRVFDRDHTTIISGVRKAEALRLSDPIFCAVTDRLLHEVAGALQ